MKELLPCPFCGGEAELTGFNAPEYWVWCPTCKASADAHTGKQNAIEAWNTRAERTCRFIPYADKGKYDDDGVCSECEELMYATDNYCPSCGAKVIA